MKTTVFLDPLSQHFWFILNGDVLCSMVNGEENSIYPPSVTEPEAATDYHIDFIKKIIADEDYQLNYHKLFSEVDTTELEIAINENRTEVVVLTPKYPT
jgi:hypothetical protein